VQRSDAVEILGRDVELQQAQERRPAPVVVPVLPAAEQAQVLH
jgi:hypothetical protein